MYEVWHRKGNGYEKAAEVDLADVKVFGQAARAQIEAANIQSAALLTAFPVDSWGDHPRIKPEPGERRPTTFGDVIIDPGGKAYRFEMVDAGGYKAPGFTEVNPPIRHEGKPEPIREVGDFDRLFDAAKASNKQGRDGRDR